MGYQTRIPAALAARGVTVETVPGWETRGSASFSPRGVVCHWTAGPASGDRPSLAVVTTGRADLPGPLAQVFLARSGVAVVVAAGRANHAGTGGWNGLSGNTSVFGIEAESTGGGDWTEAQRQAYPRVVAGLLDLIGAAPAMACGHNEWAPGRKVDIRDWDMTAMRAQVAAIKTAPTAPIVNPAPQEDPDMPIFMRNTDGSIFALRPGKAKKHLTPTEWALWVRLGATLRGGDFNDREIDIVAAQL